MACGDKEGTCRGGQSGHPQGAIGITQLEFLKLLQENKIDSFKCELPSSTSGFKALAPLYCCSTWEDPPLFYKLRNLRQGFPGGSAVKNPPANVGDMGLIPGLGRSSGEGNGNPLQYSCLENPMDREAWWDTVHGGHKVSDTTEQ